MAIDLTYPNILTHISQYKSDKRTESAAFLIWYLVNYYRLDELDATDCVCDSMETKALTAYMSTKVLGQSISFKAKLARKRIQVSETLNLKNFKVR